jgi:AraC-like DNA-binding protein
MLVLDGSFELTLGGDTAVIGAGAVVYFKKGVPFRRRVLSPLRLIYIQIYEPPELCSGEIAFRDLSRVAGTAQLLEQCIGGDMQSHCIGLLEDLLRQHFIESRSVGSNLSGETQAFFRLVAQSIGGKISISDFARSVGLSHNGFIAKFKKETGYRPVEYIAAVRIGRAKELLMNSGMRISEIAEACGFENMYYFSNTFKRQTGLSPTDYRKGFDV